MKPTLLVAALALALPLTAWSAEGIHHGATTAHDMHAGAPHGHAAGHPAAAPKADTRRLIRLLPSERNAVLSEMRGFLAGLQRIINALSREDMTTVASEARLLGRGMMHAVPMSTRRKLPVEFREMGMSTHDDFDRIALDAASLKDSRHALTQVSAVMQKCVACHEMFSLGLSNKR